MHTTNKEDLPLTVAIISSTRLLNELTWDMQFTKKEHLFSGSSVGVWIAITPPSFASQKLDRIRRQQSCKGPQQKP